MIFLQDPMILNSLPDALDLASQSLNVISGFETDIRSIGVGIPAALSGAQRFVSTKSFVLLQLTQWSLQKLLENTSSFSYYVKNPLSMMTLSVEHFHATTPVKNILMSQFQYATQFMRSLKEALKIFHPWPADYFTIGKAAGILLQKVV